MTKAQQQEFPERLHREGGMYCTRRVRPRFWSTVGKTLALVGLVLFLALMIVSGSTSDSLLVLTGGIPGKATVLSCESSGRSRTCYGEFVSDDPHNPIVLGDAVIEGGGVGGLPSGRTFPARVGSADSDHVYVGGWNPTPLIPLVLTVAIVVALLHFLCIWPVRALIHVWRPDVWPYWIGNPYTAAASRQRPRAVRLALISELALGGLLSCVLGIVVLYLITGPYGVIGVVVVIVGVWGISRLRKKYRRRART